MTGTNGEPLKIILTIAAGDYVTFGMYLLQDENGDEVEVIERDHKAEGAESITKAILKKWLRSGGPTCTYQHLIQCLENSSLGALANNIEAIVGKGNHKI